MKMLESEKLLNQKGFFHEFRFMGVDFYKKINIDKETKLIIYNESRKYKCDEVVDRELAEIIKLKLEGK